MLSILTSRYMLRELLPRGLVLTVTFKIVLNVIPFDLFRFNGGWLSASVFGVAFTGFFYLLGARVMGAEVVQAFLERHRQAVWFIPFNVAVLLGAPAVAFGFAALIAPQTLVLNGAWGLMVASVVLNIACALTHDYGSAPAE